MKLLLLACLSLMAAATNSTGGIAAGIRRVFFWTNKKTIHGFCTAYNNADYTLASNCFNEQF